MVLKSRVVHWKDGKICQCTMVGLLPSSPGFGDPVVWVLSWWIRQNIALVNNKPMTNHGGPKGLLNTIFGETPNLSKSLKIPPLQFLARLQIRPTPLDSLSGFPHWESKKFRLSKRCPWKKTASNRFDRNSSSIAASSTITEPRGWFASRVLNFWAAREGWKTRETNEPECRPRKLSL